MVEENVIFGFRLKNIDQTSNYFIEEISQNVLISKKLKKVCLTLNYIKLLLILVTGCVAIFAFASLVGLLIGIASYVVGLKICVISKRIKNYESIFRKTKKKHDKIVLLAENKSNTIKVLISRLLINSYISHDLFQ